MVDQRGGGLGGDGNPGGRGSGERAGDGGGEGGREDGGDASPSRRVGSLNGGSDNLGGRVDGGSRHNNNGRGVGSGSRHDDNSRRLRARVAVLVGVLAVANVDSGATGDTNVDAGAGEVVIA